MPALNCALLRFLCAVRLLHCLRQVVSILARDFLKLVDKSSVVREGFERLHNRRQEHNEYAEDPEILKYAAR